MRIEIYSTFVPDVPLEKHEWAGDTFASFLDAHKIEWRGKESQPITVRANDKDWPVERWEERLFPDVVVRVDVHPQGGLFKSIGGLIGKIFNAVFGWIVPNRGGRNDYNSPEQGRQLQTVDAKANQAKLGEVVPELAGRFIRYVDYLTPPRRYFRDLRYQWVTFLACVGPGVYAVNPNDARVGDTPLTALGDDAWWQFFNPGEDLFNIEASQHWHTTDEVGGTSSGTPGLLLSTEIANRNNVEPPTYNINGDYFERSTGEFPPGWGAGTTVQIEYPRFYDVVTINVPPSETAPGYQISEITGYFGHIPGFGDGSVVGFGPFGSIVQYRVRDVEEDLGGGRYTIRLETNNTSSDPIVLPPGAGQTLYFGSNVQRTIVFFTPTAITVAPAGFQVDAGAFARISYVGGTVYGEWTGEFIATPGGLPTETLEVDVFFPGGLAYVEDDGALSPMTVGVEIQYRNVADNTRATVTRSYTQATLDQIGFTEQIPVANIVPAVRMRRVGAEATSTQVQDKCHWYGLKARLPTRTIYPNWTTMGVALRSGGRIAAQSENQINVTATRVLESLQPDGSWGNFAPTRDITAFARYIAQTIGYTDADLDMEEFRRLDAIWKARGDTLDHVFDLTTVKEALQLAFAAGMGEFTVTDGKIRPVREGVRTTFEQAYSAHNMTGPLRRTFRSLGLPEDFDGVEVEYTDESTWTKQVVRCGLPGDNFFKVEKISIAGVTSRTRAWRIGMRRRRQLRYRLWSYSFNTELDALNSEYKSYVPLFDDIPGYGQSAILVGIVPNGDGRARMRVNEELKWEDGANHIVGYRSTDGKFVGSFAAERGTDNYEIIAALPQPWPAVTLKMEPPHVYFGVAERFCFPALIEEINPRGNEAVSVTAVNYDARIYADDDNAPA